MKLKHQRRSAPGWNPILLAVGMSILACRTSEPPRSVEETAPTGELAYVTNEDSGDLTVISTSTHEVIVTIPVGTRPRGVKVSPDGRTVYVALSGSPKCPPWISDEECAQKTADKTKDGIAVVDVAARRVTRVLPGGSDPEQFDVSKEGRRLYVSNEDVDAASIVDVDTGEILHTVEVGREPEGVRLSPDGRRVYVTGETDHDITVLDADSGDVLAKFKVGHRPRDAVFSSDGSRAYVSSELDGTVSVVDAASNAVTDTITLPEGSRSMGLAVSADDHRLYVTNGRAKTLSEVDLSTLEVVRSVEVGTRPWGIALTSDGKRLYTANGPSNDVSVVDVDTLEVVTKIPVGDNPWGVVIAPSPDAEP